MTQILFAFDKQTSRSIDSVGRMRVKNCILSTAEVNPYRGREIPGHDKLGLSPDEIYDMYREPAALADAVASFEGVPLMVKHVPQTAAEPQKDYQAGSVHTVRFDGKKLRGDLLITDQYAIDLIESEELADLSGGYRFTPVMESGTINGVRYDGRMTNIEGNHVALVKEGRATDAHVADSAIDVSKQSPDTTGAKKMAFPDGNTEGTAGTEANAAPAAQTDNTTLAAIGESLKQIAAMISALKPAAPAAAAPVGATDSDPDAGAIGAIGAIGAQGAQAAQDEGDPALPAPAQEGTPARGDKTPLAAMDEKTVQKLTTAAVTKALNDERARVNALDEARREVRSVIGDVFGMDSASQVYKTALEHVGIKDITEGAERAAWTGYKTAISAAQGTRPQSAMAMDSANAAGKVHQDSFLKHLSKISVKG